MHLYCTITNKFVSNKKDILIDKNTQKQNYPLLFHKLLCEIYKVGNEENQVIDFNKTMVVGILYSYVISMYVSLITSDKNMIKNKYIFLNDVLNNIFYKDEIKELFFSYFSKIQKSYFGFIRFIRLYKFKKAKIQINTDLYMNDLDEKKSNVFSLLQNGHKYLFSATDLVNIMNNSLSNTTSMFFIEPLVPKNPYNNMIFDISSLYNIYFFMKKQNFTMPFLFQQYFSENFILDEFRNNNECFIRDFSIKRYIYSSSPSILYNAIIMMIKELKISNNKYKILCIDNNFPKDKLVNIMRPYLHLYYLSKYYIYGTEKRNNSYEILLNKFDLFVRFNPCFGRKNIKIIKNGKRVEKKVTSYNDVHINFYKKYDKSVFKKLPNIVNDEIFEQNHYVYNINNLDSRIRTLTGSTTSGIRFLEHYYVTNSYNEDSDYSEEDDDQEEEEDSDEDDNDDNENNESLENVVSNMSVDTSTTEEEEDE